MESVLNTCLSKKDTFGFEMHDINITWCGLMLVKYLSFGNVLSFICFYRSRLVPHAGPSV